MIIIDRYEATPTSVITVKMHGEIDWNRSRFEGRFSCELLFKGTAGLSGMIYLGDCYVKDGTMYCDLKFIHEVAVKFDSEMPIIAYSVILRAYRFVTNQPSVKKLEPIVGYVCYSTGCEAEKSEFPL